MEATPDELKQIVIALCADDRVPSDVLFHRLRDILGAPEPSYTISEFCKLERFSEPTYFKMKRKGHGPEELTIPSLPATVRITAKARREWHEKMAAQGKKQPGRAFRRDRAKHAAESDNHVSKKKKPR